MDRHYQLGLLCLTHALASVDGEVAEQETDALRLIQQKEGIPGTVLLEFQSSIKNKTIWDILLMGIDFINQCDFEKKLRVFVLLYKLSEVDGRVHVSEIRLLLSSIKIAGVEFEDVVNYALAAPPLLSS